MTKREYETRRGYKLRLLGKAFHVGKVFCAASVLSVLSVTAWGFAGGFAGGFSVARAAEPTPLAEFELWTAYAAEAKGGRVCSASSPPRASEPVNVVRGDVALIVAHRPLKDVRYEASVRVGYIFSDKSRPYAQIGDQRFQFRTGVSFGKKGESRYWAWLADTADRGRLARALRTGESLVFKGRSRRGTLTTDTYDLKGASEALAAIDAACL